MESIIIKFRDAHTRGGTGSTDDGGCGGTAADGRAEGLIHLR